MKILLTISILSMLAFEAVMPSAHYHVINKHSAIKTVHAQAVKTVQPIAKPSAPIDTDNVCISAMKRHWPKELWAGASVVTSRENGKANPNAYYVNENNEGIDRGCFMVNDKYHPEYDTAKLFNPDYNAEAGYAIYKARGNWSAWYAVKGILW